MLFLLLIDLYLDVLDYSLKDAVSLGLADGKPGDTHQTDRYTYLVVCQLDIELPM